MILTRWIESTMFFILWRASLGIIEKGLYYKRIPNASKTHHILGTQHVTKDRNGVRECLVRCATFKTQECKSFNLQVLANQTLSKCELVGPSLMNVPYDVEPIGNNKDHYEIVWECFNNGTQVDDSCHCLDGYYGDHCEYIIKDCSEGLNIFNRKGVFWANYTGLDGPYQVQCETNRWLSVLQHPLPKQPTNHTWAAYRDGYGSIGSNDFYIGNEILHKMTSARPHMLKITIKQPGYWPPDFSYKYSPVSLDSETDNYTIHLGEKLTIDCFVPANELNLTCANYTDLAAAEAADILTGIDGMKFSTWDRDNDLFPGNCAEEIGGGFWYNNCTSCSQNATHIISPLANLEVICTPQNIYKTCEFDYCNAVVKISIRVL
ncbi:unnamed protein product [Owenia fusiformis]|uniref:Uncharacterized protein n=1 Tax=Owenia fusiformis TaxID=6347 RepID=A0A8J1TLG5_OWEFU|nr:unnamed protein product [Owenia fusiformis]